VINLWRQIFPRGKFMQCILLSSRSFRGIPYWQLENFKHNTSNCIAIFTRITCLADSRQCRICLHEPARSLITMYNYPGKYVYLLDRSFMIYGRWSYHFTSLTSTIRLLILFQGNASFNRPPGLGFPGHNAPPGMGPSPGMNALPTPLVRVG